MKKLNKWQQFLYQAGGVMLLAGVATAAMSSYVTIALFIAGSILFSCMQFLQHYDGNDITILRLRKQQILSCLLIMLSAFAYTFQVVGTLPAWAPNNSWLVLLAVGCVFQVYSVFRLSYIFEKQERSNHQKKTD